MLLTTSDLYNLLGMYDIDLDTWGTGSAKTVEHLRREIAEGETYLRIDRNGVCRVVEIAKLFVTEQLIPKRGCIVELRQQLPDGRIRERNELPSEKVKGGELAAEAAARGMKEELDIDRFNYTLIPLSVKLEDRASPSYPGLPSRYIIHRFEAMLASSVNLEDTFSILDDEDEIMHFFGWDKIDVPA